MNTALRSFREWLRFTQGEFADAVGVTRHTVVRWEGDRIEISPWLADGLSLGRWTRVKPALESALRGNEAYRLIMKAVDVRAASEARGATRLPVHPRVMVLATLLLPGHLLAAAQYLGLMSEKHLSQVASRKPME